MGRGTTGVLAGLALLAGAGPATGQGAGASTTLHILVVNRAHVAPGVLQAAEDDATEIYRAAGVDARWPNAGPKGLPGDPTVDLTVSIVTGDQTRQMAAHLDDQVMGHAPGSATERGRMTFVFFDRVQANADVHRIATSRVLGEVIAHEVGHLLLPYRSHTPTGIMRAAWDLRSNRLDYFTDEQAASIRRRLDVPKALR